MPSCDLPSSRARGAWLSGVLALSLWTFAGTAHALTVAIIGPSNPSPAVTDTLFRLRGELLAVGLEVAVSDDVPRGSVPTERRAALERMASERRLDAIIEVVERDVPRAVQVWTFRSADAPAEVQTVVLEPDAPNPAETLAIRSIEVLRSQFVEFDLELNDRGQPPPEADEEQQPKASMPPVDFTEGLGVAAGLSVSSSDALGPALSPLLRLDWVTPSPVVVHLTMAGFGTRPSVATELGSVRVAQQFAVVGVSYRVLLRPAVQPYAALSAGVQRTSLDGRANAPYRGHRLVRWSLLTEGSIGLRSEPFAPYYFGVAGHVQLAEPEIAIYVVDSLVTTTGRPNLLVSLAFGASL